MLYLFHHHHSTSGQRTRCSLWHQTTLGCNHVGFAGCKAHLGRQRIYSLNMKLRNLVLSNKLTKYTSIKCNIKQAMWVSLYSRACAWSATTAATICLFAGSAAGFGPSKACSSWTEGQCLNKADGKLVAYKDSFTTPRACTACTNYTGCGAWALYTSDGGHYCDLYANDQHRIVPCKQGVTSNPTHPQPPPPIPPPPKPAPGVKQKDVVMVMVDDMRYQVRACVRC